jgi:hypothetical protein
MRGAGDGLQVTGYRLQVTGKERPRGGLSSLIVKSEGDDQKVTIVSVVTL